MAEQDKTHWKKLVNPDYLGSYSLDGGRDKTVTIKSVKNEMITGADGKKEECTVAYLQNEKPMILNRTNCKAISKIYDTPFIEDWAGKKITLYIAKVKAFGEVVDALRIRPEAPKLPAMNKSSVKWTDAVNGLKNGSVTIEQIKKHYTLSAADEKAIKDEANKSE